MGDTLTLVFSLPTSTPSLTTSASLNAALSCKPSASASVTTLSACLGSVLSGSWSADATTLTITLGSNDAALAPQPGAAEFIPLVAGNIRNAPGTSLPATAASPVLSGSWGASSAELVFFLAASGSRLEGPLQLAEGETVALLAQLSLVPSAPVDAILSVGDNAPEAPRGPHLALSTTRLSFSTANWNMFQTVTVTGVADVHAGEPLALVNLIRERFESADALYASLPAVSHRINVVDSTAAELVLEPLAAPPGTPVPVLDPDFPLPAGTPPGTATLSHAGHMLCSRISLASSPWRASSSPGASSPRVVIELTTSAPSALVLVADVTPEALPLPPLWIDAPTAGRLGGTAARQMTVVLGATRELPFVEPWQTGVQFCLVAPADSGLAASGLYELTAKVLTVQTTAEAYGTAPPARAPLAVAVVAWPHVTTTRPLVASQVGSVITLVGRGLSTALDVSVAGQLAPPAVANMSASGDMTQLTLLTPGVTAEGYLAITLTHPLTGTFTSYDDLFFTNDCPFEGQFGRGLECKSCPDGAFCPGGYRLWPLPGYWTPAEDAGFVVKCSEPSERCLGGRFALCSSGYADKACANCAHGYYRLGPACVACSSSTAVFVTLVATNVVFCALFIAATLVLNDSLLNSATQFLLGVLVLYSVAKTNASAMTGWLAELYQLLSLVAMDFRFVRPGCQGLPGSFAALFYGALALALGMGLVMLVLLTAMPLIFPARTAFYANRRIRAPIIYAFIMYVTLSQLFLEALHCAPVKEPQGVRWLLVASRDIKCLSSQHIPIFLVALVGLGSFTLGLPVFTGVKLRALRVLGALAIADRLRKVSEAHTVLVRPSDFASASGSSSLASSASGSGAAQFTPVESEEDEEQEAVDRMPPSKALDGLSATARARYGFLFEQYRTETYLWSLVQLSLLLCVALANTLLRSSPAAQAGVTAAVLLTTAALMEAVRPFRKVWRNHASAALLTAACVATLLAFGVATGPLRRARMEISLAVLALLVILVLLGMVRLIGMALDYRDRILRTRPASVGVATSTLPIASHVLHAVSLVKYMPRSERDAESSSSLGGDDDGEARTTETDTLSRPQLADSPASASQASMPIASSSVVFLTEPEPELELELEYAYAPLTRSGSRRRNLATAQNRRARTSGKSRRRRRTSGRVSMASLTLPAVTEIETADFGPLSVPGTVAPSRSPSQSRTRLHSSNASREAVVVSPSERLWRAQTQAGVRSGTRSIGNLRSSQSRKRRRPTMRRSATTASNIRAGLGVVSTSDLATAVAVEEKKREFGNDAGDGAFDSKPHTAAH
ncbi:uncharacterized protein AMSG_08972 [Thecamonas trahens ATCC 50062]|uniref:IPT/TIG domain-containing protein n=1 Tax=Thecamonas trahens ATCC 50062 TaxID=461836 RepID=A0A0L0DKR9_THETB|nr:hypothetical protein AMSG_08972 [Thecamonas trahens ATCC 50062]KNC52830.1 hypothetical protein AMSG_08972 [Thecamonas trahens ATCC 50062]|eukprot:XP_013754935.1 hypothetical protein AMSG_08972 [Thecamonas trahens ATCC 50062]